MGVIKLLILQEVVLAVMMLEIVNRVIAMVHHEKMAVMNLGQFQKEKEG